MVAESIPFLVPPQPKARILSDWIRTYMRYSAYSESPDKFHFWVGVWTVAGALRRRVWIDQGYFQWTPNMYLVLVAPPGVVSKSTTLSIGANLLREVEGIKFGPDAITWQALTQSLAGAREDVLMPDGSFHPMSCLSIASSEFGTFFNPQDREMVDVLVSLWDGQLGVWEKVTKTQGSDKIENPWINIAACTTPGWIAGAFPEYLIGGGFTSRCVFVYAEHKRKLIAYPSRIIPPEFREMHDFLLHDLASISQMAGPFSLSDAALHFGEEWYEEHHKRRPKHLDNERFGGYLARKQTHIHKLAMVLSAAKKDDRVIEEEDLRNAAEFVTDLEDDMPQVFNFIGVEGTAKQSAELLAVLKTHGKLTKHELFKHLFRVMGYQEFEYALQACIQSQQADVKDEGNALWIVYRKPN